MVAGALPYKQSRLSYGSQMKDGGMTPKNTQAEPVPQWIE